MKRIQQMILMVIWLPHAGMTLTCGTETQSIHAKSKRGATDMAETRLAGFDIRQSGLKAITAEYGEPTERDRDLYCWKRDQLKICAEVFSGSQYAHGEYLQDISVECDPCTKEHAKARTGRGVGLGNSIKRAEEVYGSKYLDLKKVGLRGIEYQWKDGISLRFEVGSDQKISRITILAPE